MTNFVNGRLLRIKLRIFIYSRLLSLADHWVFGVCSTIFLVGVTGWRLCAAVLSFVYARREFYFDLYLFHFSGFVKDVLLIIRWSRLGDFLEHLRILGPSRLVRFVSRPATKLAQLESSWYWKSNPAMWLPDKMWNDIVDSFDRKYFSGAKRLAKSIKRELESFADYPYLRMRVYVSFVFLRLSKLKFPRLRKPKFFGQFLSDIRLRFSAIVASRSMLVYHGLGRNAVLYGKVPSFMVSPIAFDLSKRRAFLKRSPGAVSLVDLDRIIEEEVLAKVLDYPAEPFLFTKPATTVSKITVQQSRYRGIVEVLKRK